MSQDNYGWLIVHRGTQTQQPSALVVDPTEAKPVLQALSRHGARLEAVLATHHHHDHVGGIEELVRGAKQSLQVVGGAGDVAENRIPHATLGLHDNEIFACAGLELRALHVPGHTLGSTAYYTEKHQAVFVGDTLFASGCGRMFEGTPKLMWASMRTLRKLPDATALCCGHEYTIKNLRFAKRYGPTAAAAAAALAQATKLRRANLPTVPTRLIDERAYNPFFWPDDPEMQKILGAQDAEACFAKLRAARDVFEG